jgi:hypothetical protein
MTYELKRLWNGEPEALVKPLADLVKDNRRHEVRKPYDSQIKVTLSLLTRATRECLRNLQIPRV